MELPESPRVRSALSRAMKRLATRESFSGELAGDLRRQEYSEPEIEEVLSFLKRHKLLEDKKTAQSLIESRSGRRSIGIEKIRAELVRRGAPEESIEQILAERSVEDEQEAMQMALASKRWPEASRPRAARFLLSRGFDDELIESALERFFGSEELSAD